MTCGKSLRTKYSKKEKVFSFFYSCYYIHIAMWLSLQEAEAQ